ncbi:MAG TPA: hypothetical protein VFG83_09145 [Kofleriaceae bacterium]|nr:hypothetical protein [Kofleriaceae bacterium]
MATKTLGQTPAHDCDKGRRVWTTTLPDGTVVQEKGPWGPTELWVTPEGAVTRVKLSTSASIRKLPAYAERIRETLSSAGHVPYGKCPLLEGSVTDEAFPEELKGFCQPKTMSDKKPCPHIKHLVEKRRAKFLADKARHDARRISAEERKLKLMEEQNDLLRGGKEKVASKGK